MKRTHHSCSIFRSRSFVCCFWCRIACCSTTQPACPVCLLLFGGGVSALQVYPNLTFLNRGWIPAYAQARIRVAAARVQLKSVAMPRTNDAASFNRSLMKRPSFMRTLCVNGYNFAINHKHCQCFAHDRDYSARAGR